MSQHFLVSSTSSNCNWGVRPNEILLCGSGQPNSCYHDNNTVYIGCNRSEDRNDETSVMIENIVYGVNFSTPFNVLGDDRQSSTLLPGT